MSKKIVYFLRNNDERRKRKYVTSEYKFWIFKLSIRNIGLIKVSIRFEIEWGWE